MGATAHDNNNLWCGQTNADGTINKQNGFVDSLNCNCCLSDKPQTDVA